MELFNFRKNIHASAGLTLIELLVVIVIIGILATMGFTAVARSRNKANNSRIQAEISQIRVQADLIKNETDSFSVLCAGNTLNDAGYPTTLKLIEDDVKIRSSTDVICYATVNAYCVQAQMVPTGSGNYCIDSSGYAGTSPAACDDTNFDCN